MTTIILTGGDLGRGKMMVRCNLAEASAPIEADYCTGDGFVGTQYQCADTSHRTSGLIRIGKQLAAVAVEVPAEKFSCDVGE